MIVLDTHALVWWLDGHDRLGPQARRAIEEAGAIIVPSIAFWEVALLARDHQIDLGRPVSEWVRLVLSLSRVEVAPLSPEIAVASVLLEMHPDPADRFIVATALARGAPLVTKNGKLRKIPGLRTIW